MASLFKAPNYNPQQHTTKNVKKWVEQETSKVAKTPQNLAFAHGILDSAENLSLLERTGEGHEGQCCQFHRDIM